MGNRPTIINLRRLKDCDSSLLFRSPKALKVPSRHHVEVRVKPASVLHLQEAFNLSRESTETFVWVRGLRLFDSRLPAGEAPAVLLLLSTEE